MTADDEPATKTCPDCAETVLAAARKCRFCGYRFDLGASAEEADRDESDGGLLSMVIRRKEAPTTLPRQLSKWGVELGEDERPVDIWLGDVDGVDGYIVATDERMLFVVPPARYRKHAETQVRQHFLRDLASVRSERRRMRNVLVLDWLDGDAEVAHVGRKDSEPLREALEAGRAARAGARRSP